MFHAGMQPESHLIRAGLELVARSEGTELRAGELVARLFPFIEEASRRMSTRAISHWLKENHDLQISQPTISRALRTPEKYWEEFAGYIEPSARLVAEAANVPVDDLLFLPPEAEREIFEDMIKVPTVRGDTREENLMAYDEVQRAAEFLRQNWFRLPWTMRANLRKYFEAQDDEESEEAK